MKIRSSEVGQRGGPEGTGEDPGQRPRGTPRTQRAIVLALGLFGAGCTLDDLGTCFSNKDCGGAECRNGACVAVGTQKKDPLRPQPEGGAIQGVWSGDVNLVWADGGPPMRTGLWLAIATNGQISELAFEDFAYRARFGKPPQYFPLSGQYRASDVNGESKNVSVDPASRWGSRDFVFGYNEIDEKFRAQRTRLRGEVTREDQLWIEFDGATFEGASATASGYLIRGEISAPEPNIISTVLDGVFEGAVSLDDAARHKTQRDTLRLEFASEGRLRRVSFDKYDFDMELGDDQIPRRGSGLAAGFGLYGVPLTTTPERYQYFAEQGLLLFDYGVRSAEGQVDLHVRMTVEAARRAAKVSLTIEGATPSGPVRYALEDSVAER